MKIGRTFRWVKRLSEIARVFGRLGFADLVDRAGLGRYLPAHMRVMEGQEVSKDVRTAARLRKAFQELGPTFVKLGQMLATRPDIVPPEFIEEFRSLQEQVEPLPFAGVLEQIEHAIGSPWQDVFRHIESEPLAAGSIAQVHRGTLRDGAEVVLKVRRPGVKKVFEADIELLRILANMLEEHVEEAAPYRPREIVEQFARSVEREFDFVEEATVIESFRRAFAGDGGVKIPTVCWEATREGLIAMEEIKGRSLAAYIRENEQPSLELVRRILFIFLRQYFEEGMFHGDPHPGNIRLTAGNQIALIDFGSVGLLSTGMLSDLAVLYSAVSGDKPELAVAVLEELLIPIEGEFPEALKADIQRLIRRYQDLPAGRISPEQVIVEVIELARRYRLKLPVELVALARSMTLLFGAIKELAPGLNVVEECRPYAAKAVTQVFGPGRMLRGGQAALYRTYRLAGDLPRLALTVARRIEAGQFSMDVRHQGIEDLAREVDSASNRLAFSVVVAAVIMASSILMATNVGPKWSWLNFVGLGDVSVLGLLGFLFAGFLGMGLAWAIFRSGKL